MKIKLNKDGFNEGLKQLVKDYRVFAPKRFPSQGRFSDTDLIRYAEVSCFEEMVFDEKSEFSPKEIYSPESETLFFFTEEEYKMPDFDARPTLIFLRSCDMHSIKIMDEIYLNNKYCDNYYQRRRNMLKFAVVGCSKGFDSCFCVSMGTNRCDNYDMALNINEDSIQVDFKDHELPKFFDGEKDEFEINFVEKNKIELNIPDEITLEEVINLEMWREYDKRCVACGRCNFVCPTCTCTTTQDIFYSENSKNGERRRVWASCHVDGFSEMAGGHDFRLKYGERMRFKTMHKIGDYKRRFGYHMCIGCGRCDDTCPEYISFSNCIKKLTDKLGENDE